MNNKSSSLLYAAIFLCLPHDGFGQLMNAGKPFQSQDIPIRLETPVRPKPVEGTDGNSYMSYHIIVSNLAVLPVTINSMTISDRSGKPLLNFGKADLED